MRLRHFHVLAVKPSASVSGCKPMPFSSVALTVRRAPTILKWSLVQSQKHLTCTLSTQTSMGSNFFGPFFKEGCILYCTLMYIFCTQWNYFYALSKNTTTPNNHMHTHEYIWGHHKLRSSRVKVPPLFSTPSPLYLFTSWPLEPSQPDATGFTSDCLLLLCCVVGAPQHPTACTDTRQSLVITLLLNFRQVVTHHQMEEKQHQNAIKYRLSKTDH